MAHDVYPEILIASSMIRANSGLTRLRSTSSRRLIRSVDRIVVLGRDVKTLVEVKLGQRHSGLQVIPNWGDVARVRPCRQQGERVRERLGLTGTFVVQFMGNMGRTHGIESLTDAATRLRDDPHIRFVFIGWGARKEWLEAEVVRRQLSNLLVLPACSDEELSAYLNSCDIAVIPFMPGMSGISVPSRMYNVMAAGRPILAVADEDSELARVVREEGIGWVVPADRPQRISDAVLAARSSSELTEMGRRGRIAAQSAYSLPVIPEQYRALFSRQSGGACRSHSVFV